MSLIELGRGKGLPLRDGSLVNTAELQYIVYTSFFLLLGCDVASLLSSSVLSPSEEEYSTKQEAPPLLILQPSQ